jgi:hypothetical protein
MPEPAHAQLEVSPSAGPAVSWSVRYFKTLLVAIAVGGMIPCLIVGRSQFIGPDSWWHLFIATQDQWSSLLAEWKYVAHPPLFYPLLRLVAHFGHALLILRSVGILSGFVSTIVIGVIAGKICQYKTSALLAAAAYAFSWCMIEISCEVRAYSLALMFVLLAFDAYIDWTTDPAGGRSRSALVRFGIYSTLALLSEFYVIFFLAACAGIMALRFLVRPGFRQAFLTSLGRNWDIWLSSALGLSGLFLGLWVVQIAVQPQSQPYLHTHYWDDGSPLGLDGYLLSNFEQEIGYFTPFHIDSGVMLAVCALLLFPALIYFGFVRKNRWHASGAADAPLMLALLLAQLVILSLAARYPFGGEWRHQSIIAPFVFLTSFLLLDRVAGALRPAVVRNALFVAVAALSAADFAFGFAVYPWQALETYAPAYAEFEKLFPAREVSVVYGDQCSTVLYWAAHHTATWTLQDRLVVDGHRIVEYRMDDGSGQSVRMLRNKRAFYFDLADAEQYHVLADVMRMEKLRSIVLFDEGPTRDEAGVRQLDAQFHRLAPRAGLEIGRSVMGPNYAFAELKLR